MSCRTDGNLSKQEKGSKDKEIIMYRCNIPVIKVQHGTTLGLTKMLYESTKGNGRIIGVKPRQSSASLVCIITQDITILTEDEYDIILHADNKVTEQTDYSLDHHDKSVNTLITFEPHYSCEDETPFMYATSELTSSSSPPRYSDRITSDLLRTKCNFLAADESSTIDHNYKVSIRTAYPNTNPRYVVDWKCNQSLADQKWSRTNDLMTNDRNDEEYLEHNTPCSQDSNSTTCTVVSDTDSRSSEGSTNYSLSQVYKPPLFQRKIGDEGFDAGNVNQSEDGGRLETRHNKKWQCLYCLKSFLCRSALENHQRIHTGEKPFKCTHCGRCFSHQGNLKQHLHIHREVKPHICNICGKGFTRSNRLRDHKLSHSRATNDNCTIYVDKNVEWTPLMVQNSLSSPK